MDPILNTFSIGLLLRSLFSGIFFLISYFVATQGIQGFRKFDPATISPNVAFVALFVGIIAYSLHRSLVYPWIEWALNSEWHARLRKSLPLISPRTIETLLLRWDHHWEKDKPLLESINGRINAWADFTHLQFTGCLCLCIGPIAGKVTAPDVELTTSCPIVVAALALLVAALISNWRQHSLVDYVKNLPTGAEF